MKNNPNKATIEEMAGLYQSTILPLLIETDLFLKSLYANGYEIRLCHSDAPHPNPLPQKTGEREVSISTSLRW